jgi:hypothetical protein
MTSEPQDRELPARAFHHPACKVCNSPNRKQIEIALLLGESRPRIGKRFPDEALNRTNLCTHRNRHMEVVDAGVAEAVRARTASIRLSAAEAGDAVVGRLRTIDQLLAAGMAAAQAGLIRFTTRDLLALIDERERLAQDERTVERLEAEAGALGAAVMEQVPKQMWEAIVDSWDEKMAAIAGEHRSEEEA